MIDDEVMYTHDVIYTFFYYHHFLFSLLNFPMFVASLGLDGVRLQRTRRGVVSLMQDRKIIDRMEDLFPRGGGGCAIVDWSFAYAHAHAYEFA